MITYIYVVRSFRSGGSFGGGKPPLDETRCKGVLIKKESVSFKT